MYDTTNADTGQLSSVSQWKMVRERQAGNSALVFACLSLAVVVIVGAAIDVSRVSAARLALETGLGNAMATTSPAKGNAAIQAAERAFDEAALRLPFTRTRRSFTIDRDGLAGAATATVPLTLARLVGLATVDVTTKVHSPRPLP